MIAAYITSKVPDKLLETDFLIKPDDIYFSETGLIKESVFKMNKIVTINKNIITGELGFADSELMKELDKKLKLALSL